MRRGLVVGLFVCLACNPSPTASSHSASTPPHAKTLSSGGVIEYPVPNPGCSTCAQEGLGKVALGGDGNVWFADPAQNKVGRITPEGSITEFDVPGSGYHGHSMTRDRAGNIWIAASGVGGESRGSIMRVSPAGAVTRFAIPNSPLAVAVGSDGNVWILEGYGASSLGRLTPKGVYTEFQLPPSGGQPNGIVAGPGGYLWIVESSRDRVDVARVTTTGKGKDFPLDLPTEPLSANSIAVGPDGNLWVGARGEIDRLTPAGAVTSFPLPKGAYAGDLTTGPDGNLWFLDGASNSIGRMTVQGAVRAFPLPTGAAPYGLTAGSDGRMWFAEWGYKIASIGVTVPVPSFSPQILNFSAAPAAVQQLTVQNSGDTALSIDAAKLNGGNADAFRIAADGCTRRTIKPGGQCSVSVSLAPGQSAGAVGAYVELYDNATSSPQRAYLVGGLAACRLPVYQLSGDPSTPTTSGFVDVTTGVFQEDPEGAFTYDPTALLYRSVATPVLSGSSPATYDRQARRWLPTNAAAVSPDGSRFAYAAGARNSPLSTVHVVDVATGRDRTLGLPNRSWIIKSYAAEGIYLGQGYDHLWPGLWLVNPDTGALATVLSGGNVTAVGNGAAWLSTQNPADPHPPVEINGAPGNDEVDRRDLRTGATSKWLYMPGTDIGVLMVVGKSLVVGAVRDGVGTMLMMTAPNVTQLLKAPVVGEDLWSFASAAETSDGVWIPGRTGHLYLWTPTTGLILVADTHVDPAGACA